MSWALRHSGAHDLLGPELELCEVNKCLLRFGLIPGGRTVSNYRLSKSMMLSGIQCPKRLYLEVHRPELAEADPEGELRMLDGEQIGALARQIYPEGKLIECTDTAIAVEQTRLLLTRAPEITLFEAAFTHADVLVRSDILMKTGTGCKLVEAKSSTSIKEYHLWDCAIQSWVLEGAGYPLEAVALAHVDSSFVYPGNDDYRGLLYVNDVTAEIAPYRDKIPDLVMSFQALLKNDEAQAAMGGHCGNPFPCPFLSYCSPAQSPEYPVAILPRGGRVVDELLAEGIQDIRNIPDGRLEREIHERVRRVSISGKAELDAEVGAYLRALPYPRYYLDFETIQFAVPIWTGTRPYQQLPFQWSCHIENQAGRLSHTAFLDCSGKAPMRPFAEKLIAALGDEGPIFVYSHFEKTALNQLAEMFPDLADQLSGIIDRLVDLLPLARHHYYHPQMKGSWSIKAVLPTVAPDLNYDDLDEIHDGLAAQQAYLEAINPGTSQSRRQELLHHLHEYCKLDTLAMVRLVWFFQVVRQG